MVVYYGFFSKCATKLSVSSHIKHKTMINNKVCRYTRFISTRTKYRRRCVYVA